MSLPWPDWSTAEWRRHLGDVALADWDENQHPRDDQGRWTASGGGEDTSAHPMVRNDRGAWGNSHGDSYLMASYAASLMGIRGWMGNPDHLGDQTKGVVRDWLQRIADDKVGAEEPIYHGFQNKRGIVFKSGDTVKLPLTATAGDQDDVIGYGLRLDRADQEGEPTVLAFPKGTPIMAYAKWKANDAREFGHVYSEAITAGEFEVISSKVETTRHSQLDTTGGQHNWHHTTDVRIVHLKPVGVFDPTKQQWVKRG